MLLVSRRWTRPARTARSITSCRASIRRDARSSRSSNHHRGGLDHDFMWRDARRLPERGRIGIFNRSYYEEVLVVRVHRSSSNGSSCPRRWSRKRIWDERLADIAHFEDYAHPTGDESPEVLPSRVAQGAEEALHGAPRATREELEVLGFRRAGRKFWDDYMHAFEEAIAATASKHAPWFVVPADNKWFSSLSRRRRWRMVERLDLAYPKVDAAKKKSLRPRRRCPRAIRHFPPCATPISRTTLPRSTIHRLGLRSLRRAYRRGRRTSDIDSTREVHLLAALDFPHPRPILGVPRPVEGTVEPARDAKRYQCRGRGHVAGNPPGQSMIAALSWRRGRQMVAPNS